MMPKLDQYAGCGLVICLWRVALLFICCYVSHGICQLCMYRVLCSRADETGHEDRTIPSGAQLRAWLPHQ